jgi:CheY-like chemotaxis protein
MTILLVDDSPEQRQRGIDQLEDSHDITTLSSYVEVVEAVQSGRSVDVALLDLLMPAEAEQPGGAGLKHLGSEFPAGFSLSVKLAVLGVPKVAVATDTSHHDHPASATIDWFGSPLFVNGNTVLWIHAPTEDGLKDWQKEGLQEKT